MPMMKSAITRLTLAGSLVAAIGISLIAPSTHAAPLKAPDSLVKPRSHTISSAKPAMRRAVRPLLTLRACRDRRKLRMGVASWYGGAAIHRTASGEAFHSDALAAASRTLPFNTRVRVTNLHNGRSIVVRINDRGPFVRGRIIDVTPKAAAALGMKAHGTAPIYLEIVSRETQAAATDVTDIGRR